jgi:hypothetical protein
MLNGIILKYEIKNIKNYSDNKHCIEKAFLQILNQRENRDCTLFSWMRKPDDPEQDNKPFLLVSLFFLYALLIKYNLELPIVK